MSWPIVTSFGWLSVTLTSLPTFVTAVVISLAVPRTCKSSAVKLTSPVPESPSTVNVVASPVKLEPSPWYDPLNEPLNIPSPPFAWEAVVAKLAIDAVPAVCDDETIPVNLEPSPKNDPLTSPFTNILLAVIGPDIVAPPINVELPLINKLPVNAVLPLTLNAKSPLPVTFNDPEISAEPVKEAYWDFDKNTCSPDEVGMWDQTNRYFICRKSHTWHRKPKSISAKPTKDEGTWCGECNIHENSVAVKMPELASSSSLSLVFWTLPAFQTSFRGFKIFQNGLTSSSSPFSPSITSQ